MKSDNAGKASSKAYSNGAKPKTAPKISTLRAPENMTQQEWQRALRKQAAEREAFGIRRAFVAGEPFYVTNSINHRTYAVRYFGAGSKSNRCECMDFKTSRLGTCKHIEAISLAKGGLFARMRWGLPEHTSVYVDYVAGRKVKISIGACANGEMRALAEKYFDGSGELRDVSCDPSEFIGAALLLDPEFEWEDDALGLVIESRDYARRLRVLEDKYKGSRFDGLLKTRLHPYQVDGVRFAFAQGRTINADEMGLGKTVQALAAAELLRKEGFISSVLIICPTSLKYQWLSEIRRFTGSTAVVIEGSFVKRDELFRSHDYFYKICSFHAVSNSIKGKSMPEADLIIYDELQRLKNKDTQMGKQLRKLQSQYVIALSGTPLENKLDELYSVTQFVDQFVLGPYYRFTADTTLKDSTGKILGYKNLHEVADRLRHTLIRRRKADVKLQMPARTDTILYVPMTKEQRAIHDEYKLQVATLIYKWRRFKFLSEADRKRLMLFLSIMRMVCDSTFILDQKTRHDTKIDETKAIIANMLAQGEEKVVIFSQWERMLRVLASELKDEGVDFCFLHGGVPSVKRKGLIDRFRDDPACRIFLSTDAGATGLNLQSASLLINLDLPWNPAVLEQRIARIYRLGQSNPVQIINMVAKDTIEERMLSTLSFKSNLAAGILDGGEDAVFIESSKFDQIVETVESVIADAPATEAAPRAEAQPAVAPAPAASKETKAESTGQAKKSAPAVSVDKPAHSSHSADEMRGVVASGVAALGKIAEALQNPESTKALVDALVTEDPATGQATLSIPVPGKEAVANMLTAFAMLLNRK